jgi:hypothetical protein
MLSDGSPDTGSLMTADHEENPAHEASSHITSVAVRYSIQYDCTVQDRTGWQVVVRPAVPNGDLDGLYWAS